MNQRSISSLPKKIENLHLDENCYADVSSSFIHNCKKLETTPMFFNRWMNKLWFISVMEYYSATERNKLMIQATTWLNLTCVTLSEWNQTQKPRYGVVALTWLSGKDKTIGMEKRFMVAGSGSGVGVRLGLGMGEGLAPKEQQERILGGDGAVLCFDCGGAGI